MATDAIGNALGSSLAESMRGESNSLTEAQNEAQKRGYGPLTDEAAKAKLSGMWSPRLSAGGDSSATYMQVPTAAPEPVAQLNNGYDPQDLREAGYPEDAYFIDTPTDKSGKPIEGIGKSSMISFGHEKSRVTNVMGGFDQYGNSLSPAAFVYRPEEVPLRPFALDGSKELGGTMVGRDEDYVPEFNLGAERPYIRSDAGSGTWGSREASFKIMSEKAFLQSTVVPGFSLMWPDAADFMQHYLRNTGDDYVVDLKRVVESTDAGRDLYVSQRNATMRFAVKNAIEGEQVSFVSKRLDQYTFQDNDNWYYAVGNFSGWSNATVTKSGNQYSMEFDLNMYDRYNWNKGKSVEIFKQKVYDDDMALFHKMGVAREFNTVGRLPLTIKWTGDDFMNHTVRTRNR